MYTHLSVNAKTIFYKCYLAEWDIVDKSSEFFGIGGNVYKCIETGLLGPLLKHQYGEIPAGGSAVPSRSALASAKASPKVLSGRSTTQKRQLDEDSNFNVQKKQKCHAGTIAKNTSD